MEELPEKILDYLREALRGSRHHLSPAFAPECVVVYRLIGPLLHVNQWRFRGANLGESLVVVHNQLSTNLPGKRFCPMSLLMSVSPHLEERFALHY